VRTSGTRRLRLDLHVGLILGGRPLGHRVGDHRPAGRHRHASGSGQRGDEVHFSALRGIWNRVERGAECKTAFVTAGGSSASARKLPYEMIIVGVE